MTDLIYAVKCLEERFSSESDFGYGKKDGINCENDIATQILLLSDAAEHIMIGDFSKSLHLMNMQTKKISFLLSKRSELKKDNASFTYYIKSSH